MSFVRYILIGLALIINFSILSAQEVIDSLAQETCECVSKKNLDGLDEASLNMELGLCIVQSINQRGGDLGDGLKVNITDQVSMRQLGEKIGFKMAVKCPDILMRIANSKEKAVSVEKSIILIGTIKAITGDEFGQIILEDEEGREHKLLWLRYFKGSDQLVEDSAPFIGKKVRIAYETLEFYLPKAKAYSNRKEIKSLELID